MLPPHIASIPSGYDAGILLQLSTCDVCGGIRRSCRSIFCVPPTGLSWYWYEHVRTVGMILNEERPPWSYGVACTLLSTIWCYPAITIVGVVRRVETPRRLRLSNYWYVYYRCCCYYCCITGNCTRTRMSNCQDTTGRKWLSFSVDIDIMLIMV